MTPRGPARRVALLAWAWRGALSIGLYTACAGERPLPEAEGQALASEMRTQRPAENLLTGGLLKLRDGNGKWRQSVPVKLEIKLDPNGWQSYYLALDTNQAILEKLVVAHADGQPNRYEYVRPDGGAAPSAARTLTGAEAAIPFAGSNFWLSDLGLEFFHWPQQRLVKKEMRKGRSCRVLESSNPAAQPRNYARVLSWIDFETGGLLRAEAYDSDRKLMKEFSIGSFKKIDGRWQLKSMEIREEQTDARTRLEFDLEVQ